MIPPYSVLKTCLVEAMESFFSYSVRPTEIEKRHEHIQGLPSSAHRPPPRRGGANAPKYLPLVEMSPETLSPIGPRSNVYNHFQIGTVLVIARIRGQNLTSIGVVRFVEELTSSQFEPSNGRGRFWFAFALSTSPNGVFVRVWFYLLTPCSLSPLGPSSFLCRFLCYTFSFTRVLPFSLDL